MKEYWHLVDCANCGQQTMIGKPEDTCLFCGKSASKKEDIVAENKAEERVVPPKPKKRKKWPEYYEQNKEAIIADYRSMTIRVFLKRWHIATTVWPKLREKWGVQGKILGRKIVKEPTAKPAKRPTAKEYKEPRPEPGEFCLLITEADLAKLDDDYRLQWVLLGRIIKNRLADKNPI